MAQAAMEKEYDVDAKKYFQAVSNYESYPQFVEGMKSVKVDRKGPGHSIAQYDISIMSKDMTYTLDITDNAESLTIDWKLVESSFFKLNTGAWKIESKGAGKCKVSYSLDVEFTFSVPGLILRGLVKGMLPSMMNNFYNRAKTL